MIIELALISLTLPFASLQGGSGYYYETTKERQERRSHDGFIRDIKEEIAACRDDECRSQKGAALSEALVFRDKIKSYDVSSYVSGNLIAHCDLLSGGILVVRDCLKSRTDYSGNQKRSAVGLRRSGMNWRGYNQLRSGMNVEDVGFVLGTYGEQSSYVSSGGYSSEIRQYRAGRAMIVVSFADGEVTGYSQNGLGR